MLVQMSSVLSPLDAWPRECADHGIYDTVGGGSVALNSPQRLRVASTVASVHTRAAVLLRLTRGPAHGYEIVSALDLDGGGVYRLLRRLDEDGLVTSLWEPSAAGPTRRVYRLTEDGAHALRAEAAAMRRCHAALSAFLASYDGVEQREAGGAA